MFVCKFHVPNVISTIRTILHRYWYQILTRARFQNWNNTFLSSWPSLEMHPSIFLHKQFFSNCTITSLILFSYFIVFPPILLGMYSYTFYSHLFSSPFLRIVMLHFSNAAHFQNWTNTLLSYEPTLELHPSIFLHNPIMGTVQFHMSL